MIKYEWRTNLNPAESVELAEMLARAAAYDTEPEYSTIDFDDVQHAIAQQDKRLRHLLIWMLPHAIAMSAPDEPERIAGLLRLEVSPDATAKGVLVIDPRFRSIGITTLLLEQVGLDTSGDGGWLGTGANVIGAWARGNHPASGRLSNRFLIPRTRRMWKLIRPTDSVRDTAAAPVLERIREHGLEHLDWASTLGGPDPLYALRHAGTITGVVALDVAPIPSEEFGSCATVSKFSAAPAADGPALRGLLDGTAAVTHEAGLTGLIIYVDSGDARLVNACRLAGFQHDRTDVRYELGGSK